MTISGKILINANVLLAHFDNFIAELEDADRQGKPDGFVEPTEIVGKPAALVLDKYIRETTGNGQLKAKTGFSIAAVKKAQQDLLAMVAQGKGILSPEDISLSDNMALYWALQQVLASQSQIILPQVQLPAITIKTTNQGTTPTLSASTDHLNERVKVLQRYLHFNDTVIGEPMTAQQQAELFAVSLSNVVYDFPIGYDKHDGYYLILDNAKGYLGTHVEKIAKHRINSFYRTNSMSPTALVRHRHLPPAKRTMVHIEQKVLPKVKHAFASGNLMRYGCDITAASVTVQDLYEAAKKFQKDLRLLADHKALKIARKDLYAFESVGFNIKGLLQHVLYAANSTEHNKKCIELNEQNMAELDVPIQKPPNLFKQFVEGMFEQLKRPVQVIDKEVQEKYFNPLDLNELETSLTEIEQAGEVSLINTRAQLRVAFANDDEITRFKLESALELKSLETPEGTQTSRTDAELRKQIIDYCVINADKIKNFDKLVQNVEDREFTVKYFRYMGPKGETQILPIIGGKTKGNTNNEKTTDADEDEPKYFFIDPTTGAPIKGDSIDEVCSNFAMSCGLPGPGHIAYLDQAGEVHDVPVPYTAWQRLRDSAIYFVLIGMTASFVTPLAGISGPAVTIMIGTCFGVSASLESAKLFSKIAQGRKDISVLEVLNIFAQLLPMFGMLGKGAVVAATTTRFAKFIPLTNPAFISALQILLTSSQVTQLLGVAGMSAIIVVDTIIAIAKKDAARAIQVAQNLLMIALIHQVNKRSQLKLKKGKDQDIPNSDPSQHGGDVDNISANKTNPAATSGSATTNNGTATATVTSNEHNESQNVSSKKHPQQADALKQKTAVKTASLVNRKAVARQLKLSFLELRRLRKQLRKLNNETDIKKKAQFDAENRAGIKRAPLLEKELCDTYRETFTATAKKLRNKNKVKEPLWDLEAELHKAVADFNPEKGQPFYSYCKKRLEILMDFEKRALKQINAICSKDFDGPRPTHKKSQELREILVKSFKENMHHATEQTNVFGYTTGSMKAFANMHDMVEMVPIERIEAFIKKYNQPSSLIKIPQGFLEEFALLKKQMKARSTRNRRFFYNVGKLNKWVAAGIAGKGKADPFSKALHNLADHHFYEYDFTIGEIKMSEQPHLIEDLVFHGNQQAVRVTPPHFYEKMVDYICTKLEKRSFKQLETPISYKEAYQSLENDAAIGQLFSDKDLPLVQQIMRKRYIEQVLGAVADPEGQRFMAVPEFLNDVKVTP
ncbi:MAG: hypothetical protein JW841_00285 [Deltaproteobacteria bacterium]|nr:hypothetical protein [Deltaproteobacteria bacterium]